jgi:hypothetical protein
VTNSREVERIDAFKIVRSKILVIVRASLKLEYSITYNGAATGIAKRETIALPEISAGSGVNWVTHSVQWSGALPYDILYDIESTCLRLGHDMNVSTFGEDMRVESRANGSH